MDAAEKKERVEGMFDAIAPTYDALNHLLSLGVDPSWRRKVARMVEGCVVGPFGPSSVPGPLLLDVATGTGDLAIELARRIPAARIVGVDISENMLAVGRRKVLRAGFGERVALQAGDAEVLGFGGGEFDCVTVAFGVRNFGDITGGLDEMCRVLRRGGRCFVLEFSEPTVPLFGPVYRFYFHRVLPWFGRLVSRDGGAYTYLPRSVDDFPSSERFSEMLKEAGFGEVRSRRLTFGVARIYEAIKS